MLSPSVKTILKRFGVRNPKLLGFCFALALLQGALFVGLQTAMTGAVSFPLDDSYIHMQYAKQIARGAYFQYQDGDPVTGGATSFLYAHVLALGYLIGFHGAALQLWTLAVALASVTAVFYLCVRMGERLDRPLAGKMALVLVLCSGVLAWGFWSGMEIAFFAALLTAAFYSLLPSYPIRPRLFVILGLLALCRPEGQIVAIVSVALLFVKSIKTRECKSFVRSLSTISAIGFFIASLIGPALYFRLAAGGWGGNGLLAKSLLHHPTKTGMEIFLECIANLQKLAVYLMGGLHHRTGEFVLPGLFIFIILGLISFRRFKSGEGRWTGLIWNASLAAVMTAIATLEVWPLHNYRYILPFYPVFFFLGVLGVDCACSWIRERGFVLRNAVLTAAVLLSVLHLPVWASRFAENATTIYEKQRRAAQWMAKNLPDRSIVAINDAGALTYFGQEYANELHKNLSILDLVGLVTNGPTVPYRMGEGGLYEWMERLEPQSRPQYAAVFPSWFKQMSQVYDIFYDPLVTFPDPFDPGFGKTIYRVNWSYAGMEDRPRNDTTPSNWIVRDSLDIGDIKSEREHGYQIKNLDNRFPKIPIPYQRNFGYHEEIDRRWPGIEKEQEELIPELRQQGILNQYDIMDAGRKNHRRGIVYARKPNSRR